jgi:hypothetical protein
MSVSKACFSLFIDRSNALYCSLSEEHIVLKYPLHSSIGTSPIMVAGNGTSGSLSMLLNRPYDIFVDDALTLYVADRYNNRIQRFTGSSSSIGCSLSDPASIILDADGYVFISDRGYHRTVTSGPRGFSCIAGCLRVSGNQPYEFDAPWSIAFDSAGNLLMSEFTNGRIQK